MCNYLPIVAKFNACSFFLKKFLYVYRNNRNKKSHFRSSRIKRYNLSFAKRLYLWQDVTNKIRVTVIRKETQFLNDVPVQICFNNAPEMSAIRSDMLPRHVRISVQ